MTDEQFDRLIATLEKLGAKIDETLRAVSMTETDKQMQAAMRHDNVMNAAGYTQDSYGQWRRASS